MNFSNPEFTPRDTDAIRIAVCLSGQLRYCMESVKNIKQFFEFNHTHYPPAADVVTDYFIHTWDTNTWRYPKSSHTAFHEELQSDTEAIFAEYQPKGAILQKWDPAHFRRAWDAMFYSFSRSVMLKREYELTNSIVYDVVIKARPDVIYNPLHKFQLHKITPRHCYTPYISTFPTEFSYLNFDDIIFYGDSPTMDLVSDLYDTYKIKHSAKQLYDNKLNLDETSFYGPGCLLYEHLTNLGIHPESQNKIDYAIMRSTAVKENLDSITDYDNIKQKWRDWYI